MSANILRGRCANDCRVTWHSDHGPDRETPGTSGSPGDVRRCEHGRIWIYEQTFTNRFYCAMDRWHRVSRFFEPITFRRAVRALAQSTIRSGEPS